MAYTHSPEISAKISANRTGIPTIRKNSEFRNLHKTGFYNSWCKMKSRCLKENDPSYSRYGGRGITICDRWLSFENFYKDMYSDWLSHSKQFTNTSIDRIDNDGNYSKENCRWATNKVQCNNRRSNRVISHNGVSLNLRQWSERLGIKPTTITQRLDAYGWSVNRALTT
jgi:hypothetical protein